MNNQFDYDDEGKPKQILSCRKLSNGKYLINNQLKSRNELSQDEKEIADSFDLKHQQALEQSRNNTKKALAFMHFKELQEKHRKKLQRNK